MTKPKLANNDDVVTIEKAPGVAAGATLFLAGSLAVGFIAAKTLASFETVPAERIGAEAFLFLLYVNASPISVLACRQDCRRFHRRPGRIAALAGGAVAAGISSAASGTIYLGVYFAFAVALALVLPGLTAFAWPLPQARQATEKGHSDWPSQSPTSAPAKERAPCANPPLAKFVISYNQFTKPPR